MLYLYIGTDRDAVRDAIEAAIEKEAKGRLVLRLSDAHALDDILVSLQGPGMFDGPRIIVLDNVLSNEEMAPRVLEAIPSLKESADIVYLREEKLDAATKKKIEKHAERSERFDLAKGAREGGAFDLGYALQRGDKKALWTGYMREISKGAAPEMIHGILFWAAKQSLIKSGGRANARERALVARLAELPHEARRRGYELEYALEEFVLS